MWLGLYNDFHVPALQLRQQTFDNGVRSSLQTHKQNSFPSACGTQGLHHVHVSVFPRCTDVLDFKLCMSSFYSLNKKCFVHSHDCYCRLLWSVGDSACAQFCGGARAIQCKLAPYYTIRLCRCLSVAWLMDWAEGRHRAVRIHSGTWQFPMYGL